jgi:serine/threonine protein kinase
MATETVFLINTEAKDLDSIFINNEWKLKKVYDNVHAIYVGNKDMKWLVKVYKEQKYAKKEAKHLNKLKKVKRVPAILSTTLSDTLNYNIISRIPGRDLYDYCLGDNGVCFHELEVKKLAKQILTTLGQIHAKNIIHGDIKPENIIYDKKTEKASIIDFEGKHTAEYCSPEQVKGKKLCPKTDVWSAGVTFYTIVNGDSPFSTRRDVLYKKVRYPEGWSKQFKNFLKCMIEREIILRYSVEECLNHPWLSEE